MRTIAEAAGVSHGTLRHHFGSKAGLIDAVDDHVLEVFAQALESDAPPTPPTSTNDLYEFGSRFSRLVYEHPLVVDYVGHALREGSKIGHVIFKGLHKISIRQRDRYAADGLTKPDLDPDWAALHPLLLRLAAIMLRSYVADEIPDPFATPEQAHRWDTTATAMIRYGQFRIPPDTAEQD